MGEFKLNKLNAMAKFYIAFHVLVTCIILYYVFSNPPYSISYSTVIPFIIFGSMFEILRLNAFGINDQRLNISAGSAIILAAVMLFNPFEIILFAFCYGLSMIIFPILSPSKIIFNISQTINVTFVTFLVWNSLHMKNELLLSTDNILPFLATMAVFGVVDLLSVTIIVSIASKTRVIVILSESFEWISVSYALVAFIGWILAEVYMKFYLFGLLGFVLPLLLMRYNMYLFVKNKESQVTQLLDFNLLLKDNNKQLILTLSQIIDARENSLLGHSVTVAKYATVIAGRMNFTQDQVYDLKRSAMLHDIGKLGISETILQKPGKLTDEEFKTVKNHSLIGEKILENIKGMEKVATVVLQHHEQYSGNGYPNHLREEEILIEARIIALCDALDTMLSTRSYKQGWSIDEAVVELVRCRGTHFDPKVVNAFLEVKDEVHDGFFTNSYLAKKEECTLGSLLIGQDDCK